MPLHDRPGWDGFQLLWIAELLRWVKPRLPEGYRAYVGSTPTVGIGTPERVDVSVREWQENFPKEHKNGPPGAPEQIEAPDEEIAVATLESSPGIMVTRDGRLVAAIERVSPRNKDRQAARDAYTGKYLGYLLEGVHLVLVDVHRRPLAFHSRIGWRRSWACSSQGFPPPSRWCIGWANRLPLAAACWHVGCGPWKQADGCRPFRCLSRWSRLFR